MVENYRIKIGNVHSFLFFLFDSLCQQKEFSDLFSLLIESVKSWVAAEIKIITKIWLSSWKIVCTLDGLSYEPSLTFNLFIRKELQFFWVECNCCFYHDLLHDLHHCDRHDLVHSNDRDLYHSIHHYNMWNNRLKHIGMKII